jgi:anthranilate synthase component I
VSAPAEAPAIAVEPSLEEVREQARTHDRVPLRHTFIDDCETPVSAFLKLRGTEQRTPAFLLESAEQGQRVGRYSFIGVQPRDVVRWSLGDDGDPYKLAEDAAAGGQAPFKDAPPFTGGAIGFFGYDLVRTVETTLGEPNPDVLGLPDMALMLTDLLVIFDHLKHTVTILANVRAGDVDDSYAEAVQRIADARALLDGPVPKPDAARGEREVPEFTSNMDRATFEGMVSRIVEYVHAGDAFQVVPSQRWSADLGGIDPFSVYRGLRVVNPSPYMYFLDFLDFQIAGASPEPLLTVSGRRASTRPIAGTRPRDADPNELLGDEKERAEHVMLVDLGRNDLGRVCEYGSVQIDPGRFMAIELYSHVMHIVSAVSGTLREDVTPMDALRSILPAGTLSGAPKVRAMEIIDELEPIKRGGYGGAIGYLSYSGDLDTCIHIRTVVIKDGTAHIQAGGGTVADAKPEYEYEESVNKSKAVKGAIALAASQRDWA